MILGSFFKTLTKKLFGDKQARDLRLYMPRVQKINDIFATLAALSDDQLRAKTDEFRQRLAAGQTLDDLVHEAFAVVKETCRRHCGQTWLVRGKPLEWRMVPYDVQLMAGLCLYDGKIAEQQTGEGKTLTAILPLYTHALAGKGAHLVTVNDYLAKRDCEWNGPIFKFLGLTVDCIDYYEPNTAERRAAYQCDVTYGTNNEFGFDYLRDNMATQRNHLVQRELNYAIVDEVDSILIDESRTPLIISGPVDRSTHQYDKIKPMVEALVRKQVTLVNELMTEAEKAFEELQKGDKDAEWQLGRLLLLARRGAPKHRRLMRLTATHPAVERHISRVERDFMIEKKMHELDAELYYVIDEKGHSIDLTDKGRHALAPENPEMFVLSDLVEKISEVEGDASLSPEEKERRKDAIRAANEQRADELHNISQLLRAYMLYEKDVEYVVEDNKVIIVDENTGRKMPGRRWSDGLHQAVEAKENVRIEVETQTLATITVQNFFRMYHRLAGMTGTAETEASEFYHTYKMDVVVVPPNVPTRRVDKEDLVYRTIREKYNALIEEVEFLHKAGLPVLVGTVSVEVSEILSRMLKRNGISHNVLNAKNHEREADIVADAGKPGQVTIATNMAGRGTDIKLQPDLSAHRGKLDEKGMPIIEVAIPVEGNGGKTETIEIPYGLQIIGSERHEARRIDRQLRGRSGRQGDAGSSQFFLSLEDNLMRLFGSDRIAGIMERLGMEEGEPIQHRMVTGAIERAQKRIEGIHFGQRAQTLKYDDVMNKQRVAIYGLRRRILLEDDLSDVLLDLCFESVSAAFKHDFGGTSPDAREWDAAGFLSWVRHGAPNAPLQELEAKAAGDDKAALGDPESFVRAVMECVAKAYELKAQALGPDIIRDLTRFVLLDRIDDNWRAHLAAIDELREGIWMRGQAQLDPLIEYQREASLMFEEMMDSIYREVFQKFFRMQVVIDNVVMPDMPVQYSKAEGMSAEQLAAAQGGDGARAGGPPVPQKVTTVRRAQPKVGRNDPCPCGSGKKYKKCCGA